MGQRKHFNIHVGPTIRHDTVIEMDGTPLTNVSAITIAARAGVATAVTVEFINVDVNLDLPEFVEVSDKDDEHKVYVRTDPEGA